MTRPPWCPPKCGREKVAHTKAFHLSWSNDSVRKLKCVGDLKTWHFTPSQLFPVSRFKHLKAPASSVWKAVSLCIVMWSVVYWDPVSPLQLFLWTGGIRLPTVWLHAWRSETCLTLSCKFSSPRQVFDELWAFLLITCALCCQGGWRELGSSHPRGHPGEVQRQRRHRPHCCWQELARGTRRDCDWGHFDNVQCLCCWVTFHSASHSLHRVVSTWSVSLQSTQGKPSRHFTVPGLMVNYLHTYSKSAVTKKGGISWKGSVCC